MGENMKIEEWISAYELTLENNKEPFYGASVQAGLTNGNVFIVIFNKADDSPIEAAIEATPKQVKRMKAIGMLEDSK